MSRRHFFRPGAQVEADKDNTTTRHLVQNEARIGVPAGWIKSYSAGVNIDSYFSKFDPNFLTCRHLSTDFRLVHAYAYQNAVDWAKKFKTSRSNSLEEIHLIHVHLAINLYCTWRLANGIQPISPNSFVDTLTSLGADISAASLQNKYHDTVAAAIRKMIDPADNKKLLPDNYLGVKDFGVPGMHQFGVFREISTGVATGVAFDFDCDAKLTGNWLIDSLVDQARPRESEFNKGFFFLWQKARTANDTIQAACANALMLLVGCLCKGGSSTQEWINKRSRGLEEAMDLASGTIEISPESMNLFHSLSKIQSTAMGDIYQCMVDIAMISNHLNIPRFKWMVDQAAFTGCTIVTLFFDILSRQRLPWGLLFKGVEAELKEILTAAVWCYKYPYAGLRNIKYPATKYPTIATAMVKLANLTGMKSFSRFKGSYGSVNSLTVDRIVQTYIQWTNDLTAANPLLDAVNAYTSGAGCSVRIVSGLAHFDTSRSSVKPGQPTGWDADLWTLTRNVAYHNVPPPAGAAVGTLPTAVIDAFDLTMEDLVEFLCTKDNGSASDLIKALYQCILPLHTYFMSSPAGNATDASQFENLTNPRTFQLLWDIVGGDNIPRE